MILEQKHTGKNKKIDTRKLATMGMLAAIGVMLVAVIEFPIFPGAPFLKYDPADIPILIGSLVFGPVAGLILTGIVSFIQSFMLRGSGGIIGFIMHFIATGAMALVAGTIYKKAGRTFAFASVSLVGGAIAMTVAMVYMNLVLTPIFMGTPVEVVKSMMIPLIIPFNLIKAGINCACTLVVFRYVEKIVYK